MVWFRESDVYSHTIMTLSPNVSNSTTIETLTATLKDIPHELTPWQANPANGVSAFLSPHWGLQVIHWQELVQACLGQV